MRVCRDRNFSSNGNRRSASSADFEDKVWRRKREGKEEEEEEKNRERRRRKNQREKESFSSFSPSFSQLKLAGTVDATIAKGLRALLDRFSFPLFHPDEETNQHPFARLTMTGRTEEEEKKD